MTELNREQAIQKVRELLKEMRICMLTTVTAEGALHSRPMAMQEAEFDGDLWFFTERDSEKAAEIRARPQVNVSARSDDKHSFVSLSGRAEFVHDPAKVAELWSPLYVGWFPGGMDDPQLALIRVDAETVEYWETPAGGVLTYLLNLVKGVDVAEKQAVAI